MENGFCWCITTLSAYLNFLVLDKKKISSFKISHAEAIIAAIIASVGHWILKYDNLYFFDSVG